MRWLRWKEYWAFSLLCLLTASRWLFENADPASGSTFKSEAAGLFLAATFFSAVLLRPESYSDSTGGKVRPRWTTAAGVALILAGPALASALAGRTFRGNDAAMALVLSPVVAALASRARSDSPDIDLTRLLWPSLAAITGILLLVTQPSFREIRAWLGLAALTILVGLGAVLASSGPPKVSTPSEPSFQSSAALGLLLAAVVLFGFAWVPTTRSPLSSLSWTATALDGTQALLTILALRRLGAYRWTTQFLLIPLLGILEGVFLLHPTLDGRLYCALTLLAVSSVYQLLFALPSADQETDPATAGVL